MMDFGGKKMEDALAKKGTTLQVQKGAMLYPYPLKSRKK